MSPLDTVRAFLEAREGCHPDCPGYLVTDEDTIARCDECALLNGYANIVLDGDCYALPEAQELLKRTIAARDAYEHDEHDEPLPEGEIEWDAWDDDPEAPEGYAIDYDRTRKIGEGRYAAPLVPRVCSRCGGALQELSSTVQGKLGLRTHYRCRECGAEASEEGTA